MRKMLALVVSFTLTYMACDARACDVGHAEAEVMVAQEVKHACFDPSECRLADAYVAAALEELRTARALCEVPGDASPFEPGLMATVPDYQGDDGAFRAVMGEE